MSDYLVNLGKNNLARKMVRTLGLRRRLLRHARGPLHLPAGLERRRLRAAPPRLVSRRRREHVFSVPGLCGRDELRVHGRVLEGARPEVGGG